MTGCRPEVAMRLLKLLLILFVCAAAVLATVVVMLGPYEDAKAGLRIFVRPQHYNYGGKYCSGAHEQDQQQLQQAHGDFRAAACHGRGCAASNLDTCTGYLGFHSRASFCASAICAGVILAASWSRSSIALSRYSLSDASKRNTARLNHM